MAIPNSWFTGKLTAMNDYSQGGKIKANQLATKSSITNPKLSSISSHKLIPNPKHQDFINKHYAIEDELNRAEYMQKLKDVSLFLKKLVQENPLEGLVSVDAVQRLGLDHHFQHEIDAILKRQYKLITTTDLLGHQDLYMVSICFRLLRQHGYYVTADVFAKFIKGKKWKSNPSLTNDIKGLMSLYEASQLVIEGEDILDEAADFTSQRLSAMLPFLHPHDAKTVRKMLEYPYHKTLPWVTSKNFNDYYENSLSELAKMEFKLVQSVHKMEMLSIFGWWNDLGLAKELKYARNEPLKWHMCAMAILADPSFSEQRIDLTKPISMIYIIDDIFDVYGNLDELTLFTEAVNRWDMEALDQLPDYMKMSFEVINEITDEISHKVCRKHGFNPANYLQKTWKSLFDAFLVEAKWFTSGHSPNKEDYLKNGIISSGVHVVLVHLYFLLGYGTSPASAAIIDNNPGIISNVATILRLWDDLGSSQDENQNGQDGSYVKCYLEQHKGSSAETARKHVVKLISDSWKRLNKECLIRKPYSATFTTYSLNIARMVPLMYSYDENHRLPVLEEHMRLLLSDGAADRVW